MERLTKIIVLLMIATVPAAAPRDFAVAPRLCFTAGSTTFQLSSTASAPDYRVKFVASETGADMRVQIVDQVDTADFAVVDDFAPMPGSPCDSAGHLRTVRVVNGDAPADAIVNLSREAADHKLFVHSGRFGHRDAAALFAAVLHYQAAPYASESD
jgi:hypothetical protein